MIYMFEKTEGAHFDTCTHKLFSLLVIRTVDFGFTKTGNKALPNVLQYWQYFVMILYH